MGQTNSVTKSPWKINEEKGGVIWHRSTDRDSLDMPAGVDIADQHPDEYFVDITVKLDKKYNTDSSILGDCCEDGPERCRPGTLDRIQCDGLAVESTPIPSEADGLEGGKWTRPARRHDASSDDGSVPAKVRRPGWMRPARRDEAGNRPFDEGFGKQLHSSRSIQETTQETERDLLIDIEKKKAEIAAQAHDIHASKGTSISVTHMVLLATQFVSLLAGVVVL